MAGELIVTALSAVSPLALACNESDLESYRFVGPVGEPTPVP
ncbi:MAG: hypothetical protein OXE40_12730 [Gammaproteobacteria bacterium]|nr:hypothetical protein [Gammaproteobacteria bacterium]